ncbi:helix-turn-helix transcriptional regulator [Micromonospora sp. KLBMP9576]|uniref:helix-turn-helix transcriptional regulator n=1 Tax=Micromonospora sp. KLBMP9576 TaxID=3424769 RepID=UPI003D90699B
MAADLLLDDEEAVAIAVGLRTAAGHAVTGIEEASVRALTKLEQVLPARLRHRVGALSAATESMLTWSRPTVGPEQLTGLAAAIANRERLRFAYRRHDGVAAERRVEPHRLVSAGRRWYLAAYVTKKLLERTPTHRAVATLHAPVEAMAGRVGDAPGDLVPIDANSCRLSGHTDTLEWLAWRLLTLGCEFEVHEPPELVAYLRAISGRAARAAGPAPTEAGHPAVGAEAGRAAL